MIAHISISKWHISRCTPLLIGWWCKWLETDRVTLSTFVSAHCQYDPTATTHTHGLRGNWKVIWSNFMYGRRARLKQFTSQSFSRLRRHYMLCRNLTAHSKCRFWVFKPAYNFWCATVIGIKILAKLSLVELNLGTLHYMRHLGMHVAITTQPQR